MTQKSNAQTKDKNTDEDSVICALGIEARKASAEIAQFSTTAINDFLQDLATTLINKSADIIATNQKDLSLAKEKALSPALIDRLTLNPNRIEAMANSVIEIAKLDDPVGVVLETTQRPNGLVIEKVSETLAVYPEIKGIQVLNDEGDYMFSSYAGKWIPDSSEIRRNITRTLRFWNPPSDSSPVEGITEAINTFYTPDRKISIYVFGDDFSRGSVEAVCRYVAQINKADRFGNRLVRIHGIGFPTQTGTSNGAKFANLMRKLSEQNGGTFVALPTL